jgi:hypothetical protein
VFRRDNPLSAQGVVTHDIDATLGLGRANVGGEDWAARAHEPIATGTSPCRRRRRHRIGGHCDDSFLKASSVRIAVPADRPDADDRAIVQQKQVKIIERLGFPPHGRSRPEHDRAVPDAVRATIDLREQITTNRNPSSRATT